MQIFIDSVLNFGILGILLIVMTYFVKVCRQYISTHPISENNNNNKKALSEILYEARISKKLTQEFVAQAIGVSRQSIYKWEKGLADPTTSNLIELAKLYELDLSELTKQIKTN